MIWIGLWVCALIYSLFSGGVLNAIVFVINSAWFVAAYLGHLKYPRISRGEAVFWTLLISFVGVWKFLRNWGRE